MPSKQPPKSRTVRKKETASVLFLDVVGYSQLRSDEQYGKFFDQVIPKMATTINVHHPMYSNSWGDALVCVFQAPLEGAQCALDLRDFFRETDWSALGIREDLKARIGLHSGVIWVGEDPVQNRFGVAGYNINLGARIEPVATPNEVWASQTFINLLQTEHPQKIAWIDLGERDLAKQWGSEHLYRLIRKHEPADSDVSDVELPELEAIKTMLQKYKAEGFFSGIEVALKAIRSRDVYDDLRISMHVEPLSPSSESPLHVMCNKFTANLDMHTYMNRPILEFAAYITDEERGKMPSIANQADFDHRINIPSLRGSNIKQFREMFSIKALTLSADGKRIELDRPKEKLLRKDNCYLLSYRVNAKSSQVTSAGKRVRLRFKVESIINRHPQLAFYSFNKVVRNHCNVSFFVDGNLEMLTSSCELYRPPEAEPYYLTARAIEYDLDGPILPNSTIRFEWKGGERGGEQPMGTGGGRPGGKKGGGKKGGGKKGGGKKR